MVGLLLQLLRRGVLGLPVRNRRSENGDIGRERGLRRGQHFVGGLDPLDLHADRRRQGHRPGNEGDIGPGGGERGGHSLPLLPRRAVGHDPHRVDRLVGRAGRDQRPLPGQRLGREEGFGERDKVLGLGQAA